NAQSSSEARIISPEGSPVTLLVIPTNEEWEIARETLQAISSPR
ncbi:MAG: acetate kinase, partial [Microbacteriaceae bacterium]|nr:acetate kinase [Microbacteriaceae bacterium]